MFKHSSLSRVGIFVIPAIIVAVLITGILVYISKDRTAAVSATDFNAGRIIDDSIFYNKDTMNVQQIQAFLDRLIPNCDIWGSQKSEYGGGTRAQYAASQGWHAAPYSCLNKYYENPNTGETSYERGGGWFAGSQSSAEIIYNAAQKYGINPQVLLVLLKKESAGPLTSDSWPLKSQYRYAMGYACPDSGPNNSANCDSSKAGLYKQVELAAWQLKYYKEHPNDYRYKIGWNNIQYSPNIACGTKRVYIENIATLSLYIYTPYTPNDAALANYPGEASCGAYGNRNFFMFFAEWFGSPSTPAPTTCNSKVTSAACVWSVRKGDGSQFLTTSEAELKNAMYTYGWQNEGIVFYASNNSGQGLVPVYRLRKDNLHYYSADQQEYNTLKNTAGWSDEGVRFYTYPSSVSENASYKVSKLYNPVNGNFYWVNDNETKDQLLKTGYVSHGTPFNSLGGLIRPTPAVSGRHNIYSLKYNDTYLNTTNFNEAESAIRVYGYQYIGILSTASASSTDTPVYRLQGNNSYLLTTSPSERDSAVRNYGFVDQGVRFYIDAETKPIYRLSSTSTSRYRYSGDTKEAMSLSNNGWLYQTLLDPTQVNNAPVYRFIDTNSTNHFYTIDASEAMRISNKGWQYEKIAFYASKTTGAPVYRLYAPNNHFYTTSATEKDNAVKNHGFKDEGVRFYVNNSSDGAPVYRMYGNGEHFYTADVTEKNAAVKSYGYEDEGERFFLAK